MLKVRMFLINLLAGRMVVMLNATVYGETEIDAGEFGMVYGCTFHEPRERESLRLAREAAERWADESERWQDVAEGRLVECRALARPWWKKLADSWSVRGE